jgi:hypothetical protein
LLGFGALSVERRAIHQIRQLLKTNITIVFSTTHCLDRSA